MDFNIDVDSLLQALLLYLPKVLGAVLVLVVGFFVAEKLGNLLTRVLRKRGTDNTIIPFFRSLVTIGLKVLVLISAAGMFGIQTTSFVAILGALAFAVGFALQGSLSHFASGVMLLSFRPYKVGDLVTIGGGQTGHVTEIGIFNTVLRTLDNHAIIVPNGSVTENVITNISGQGTVGVPLTFGIGYEDSIDRAREIILEVADGCPYLLESPAPTVSVSEHGDSAVMLTTRPFCKSAEYWPAYFHMMEFVKKGFDAGGVSIPYPQRDVHVVDGALTPPPAPGTTGDSSAPPA